MTPRTEVEALVYLISKLCKEAAADERTHLAQVPLEKLIWMQQLIAAIQAWVWDHTRSDEEPK